MTKKTPTRTKKAGKQIVKWPTWAAILPEGRAYVFHDKSMAQGQVRFYGGRVVRCMVVTEIKPKRKGRKS